jgi:YD repeat-containing protein
MHTTFTYDYTNRNFLWHKYSPGETTVTFTYDDAGNRKTMADITGTSQYDYFPTTGALRTVTTQDIKTINYQYDAQ